MMIKQNNMTFFILQTTRSSREEKFAVKYFSSTSDFYNNFMNEIDNLREKLEDFNVEAKITREELDLLFNYKKRIKFIIDNLNLESEKAAHLKLLKRSGVNSKDSTILELEKIKIESPSDSITGKKISYPGDPSRFYVSGESDFDSTCERNLIILELVNAKYPELKITTQQQIEKITQLDEGVSRFVSSIKELYVLIGQMDSLVFEAEISRDLFEEYIKDSEIYRKRLNKIADKQAAFLKMYKDFIELSDKEKHGILKDHGIVLRVMRLTQKDLPYDIKTQVISKFSTTKDLNEGFKKALENYKRYLLSSVSSGEDVKNTLDSIRDPKQR